MEPGSMLPAMRALLHTEFAALLARAGVSQAAFARLSGVTLRPGEQVGPRPCRRAALGGPAGRSPGGHRAGGAPADAG